MSGRREGEGGGGYVSELEVAGGVDGEAGGGGEEGEEGDAVGGHGVEVVVVLVEPLAVHVLPHHHHHRQQRGDQVLPPLLFPLLVVRLGATMTARAIRVRVADRWTRCRARPTQAPVRLRFFRI